MSNHELSSYIVADETAREAFVAAARGLVDTADSRLTEQTPAVQAGPEVRKVTLQHGDILFQIVKREIPGHEGGDLWVSTRSVSTEQLENGKSEQVSTIELPRTVDAVTERSTGHLMVHKESEQLLASAADFTVMREQIAQAQVPDKAFTATQQPDRKPQREFTVGDMLTAAPNVSDLLSRRTDKLRQTAKRLRRKPVAA